MPRESAAACAGRAAEICRALSRTYPDSHCELDFTTPLELLIATILSGPLLLIGIIWVLQGLNILPGSFMTGQIIWAIYGAPMAVVGAGLVWWVNRGGQTR